MQRKFRILFHNNKKTLREDANVLSHREMTGNIITGTFYGRAAEAYSKPNRMSKMEAFAKILNCFQPLSVLAKSFILDVWMAS